MTVGARRSWMGGLVVAWLLTSGLLEFAFHRVPDGRHHDFTCEHTAIVAAAVDGGLAQLGVTIDGEDHCAPCLLQTPPSASRGSIPHFEQWLPSSGGDDVTPAVVAERRANRQRGPP